MTEIFNKKNKKNNGLKVCILDLDETLVHSWENPKFIDKYEIYTNPSIYESFRNICYSFDLPVEYGTTMWGLIRPHAREFLQFCYDYFEYVIVWSAGVEPYVHSIVDYLFSDFKSPHMIWSREHCMLHDELYHKPIGEIIEYLKSNGYLSDDVNLKNTIIIDDRQHTFMKNKNNGILIPPYHPGKKSKHDPKLDVLLDRSDDSLIKIMEWLNRDDIKRCNDIQKIEKNIFKK